MKLSSIMGKKIRPMNWPSQEHPSCLELPKQPGSKVGSNAESILGFDVNYYSHFSCKLVPFQSPDSFILKTWHVYVAGT